MVDNGCKHEYSTTPLFFFLKARKKERIEAVVESNSIRNYVSRYFRCFLVSLVQRLQIQHKKLKIGPEPINCNMISSWLLIIIIFISFNNYYVFRNIIFCFKWLKIRYFIFK